MITFVNGNIFESSCQALVNPVNCVGVMGAGLAKQFKERYSGYYMYYRDQCHKGNIRVGEVDIYGPVASRIGLHDQYLISFPAKDHYKDPSELPWISRGLASLMVKCHGKGIKSVAIPPLGCGLGGLNWADVRELIAGASMTYPSIDIEVYVPQEKRNQWQQCGLREIL